MNCTCGLTSKTRSSEETKGHDIIIHLYSLGLYKRQYRVPVASDYRGRDNSLFSMRSLEDRRQRPTLLLHMNRRKVEAFFHTQCDHLSLTFMFATVE